MEAISAERKTVSIMRACKLVDVSRRTIYNWIAGGKVEYIRTAGGSIRIFVDTLLRRPDDPMVSRRDGGGPPASSHPGSSTKPIPLAGRNAA